MTESYARRKSSEASRGRWEPGGGAVRKITPELRAKRRCMHRSVSGDGFPPLWGSAWCVREKVVQRAKPVLLRDGLFCFEFLPIGRTV